MFEVGPNYQFAQGAKWMTCPRSPHVLGCPCPKYYHLQAFHTKLQREYTRKMVYIFHKIKKGKLEFFLEILKLILHLHIWNTLSLKFDLHKIILSISAPPHLSTKLDVIRLFYCTTTSRVLCSWSQLKCDGTRAETRFRLSCETDRVHLNRPVGVSSVDCWQQRCAASAVVMLDTPCSEVVWRVLAPHSIRRFPLHFLSRASPVSSHLTGLYQSIIQVRGFLCKRFVNRICFYLVQPASFNTTPCRLSAIAYSIYSHLPSMVEAVPPLAPWGRAMPVWQGPIYQVFTVCRDILNTLFIRKY